MAIKSPKAKGVAGERELAALLTQWAAGVGVKLNLDRNLEQVRYGGADINGVPNLEIEVKRVEQYAINSWWRQVCVAAKKSGKRPLLAHRKNRQPWRFRVRTEIAMQNGDQWCHFTAVVDLELDQAKAWFQEYIKLHKDELDELPTTGTPPPPPRPGNMG